MFSILRHMFLGHDMSVSDFDGRTPLHLAAAEGHLECVKFLLQSSCEVPVEPTDRYGLGFFIMSMILNYILVKLLHRCIMLKLFCRWGFTPLSEAERFGHTKVAEYIKMWIMREAELDGGTLTEIEGKKLLQQLQEMATNK